MIALAMASNRIKHLEWFLEKWCDSSERSWPFGTFYLVYADTATLPKARELIERYSFIDCEIITVDEIQSWGPDAECISIGDPGIKMAALLKAVRSNEKRVLILDDDCFPVDERNPDFVARAHLAQLSGFPRFSSPLGHLHVRGLPYERQKDLNQVAASVGLWDGIPDFDAIHSLAPTKERSGMETPGGYRCPRVMTQLLNPRQLTPLCGMNFAINTEAAPASYFPKMGNGTPFFRFDDIWGGWILQRICRQLGWSIAVGNPVIHHSRASKPMINLVREAPGVLANEFLVDIIDNAKLTSNTFSSCAMELGEFLMNPVAVKDVPADSVYEDTRNYVPKLGLYLQQWVRLLESR